MQAKVVALWWLAAVSSLLLDAVTADYNPDAAYTLCRFAKGSLKLYNCHPDRRSPQGYANLSDSSSPRRYLVKLKDQFDSTTVDRICVKAETGNAYRGHCVYRYKKVWLGMLMMMSEHALARFVEKEATFIEHIEVEGTATISIVQNNPPWGLDRIDHLPGQSLLNKLYNVSSGGDGVHVYVLDTGIRCTHQEFWYSDGRADSKGRRLSRCLDGFDGIRDGEGVNDCNGHGTHCAGVQTPPTTCTNSTYDRTYT